MNIQSERSINFPVSLYAWRFTEIEIDQQDPITITNQELEIVNSTDDNLAKFLNDRSRIDGELTITGVDYLLSSMLVHRVLRNHTQFMGFELPILSESILDQIKDREFDTENNRPLLHHLDEKINLGKGRFGLARAAIKELMNPLSRKLFTALTKAYVKDFNYLFRTDRVMLGILYGGGKYSNKDIHKNFIKRRPDGGRDIYFAYKSYADTAINDDLRDR